MNRHYTPEEYLKGVEILRSVFEHPAITTDIIVGFPGETDGEFMETYDFAQRVGFYEMHIFKYSKRKGTKAAVMPDQINEGIKARRSAMLLEMEARDSRHFREYYVGSKQEVLIEEVKKINNKDYYIGHTREYVKVATEEKIKENTLVTGIIEGFLTDEILLMR
jgi:threonylcarbamoyladenosine tRNA methylthiotransferase MtaB